jgi:hypothetical protein
VPLAIAALPNMTVSSGGTATNAVGGIDDAWALSIYSPATTFTSTAVSIQVEPTSTGTDFITLQSAGTDVVLTSGRAIVISPVPFRQIRIGFGAAEAVGRTFTIRKSFLV